MSRSFELVPVVLADGWKGDLPRAELLGGWAWCPCGAEYLECESCDAVGCAECCGYMWVCSAERVLVCGDCAWECSCCGAGMSVAEAEERAGHRGATL